MKSTWEHSTKQISMTKELRNCEGQSKYLRNACCRRHPLFNEESGIFTCESSHSVHFMLFLVIITIREQLHKFLCCTHLFEAGRLAFVIGTLKIGSVRDLRLSLGFGTGQGLWLRLPFSFPTHAVGPRFFNRVCVKKVTTKIGSIRIALSLATGMRGKRKIRDFSNR